MHTSLDYENVYASAERIKSYGHRVIDFVFEKPIVAIISAIALFIILNSQVWILLSAYVAFRTIDFIANPFLSSQTNTKLVSSQLPAKPQVLQEVESAVLVESVMSAVLN